MSKREKELIKPPKKRSNKALPEVRGKYRENVPLAPTTWFRVGGPAETIFRPADYEDLGDFLKGKSNEVPVTPIGVGSNLLVRDGGVPGVVVRLGRGFTNIALHDGFLDVGAGVLDSTVAQLAAEEGIKGLDFFCGIPGTIGGALRMNAGCYGTEVKDVLEAAFVLDPKGKLHELTLDDLGYTYRHCGIPKDWIFIGARFKAPTGNQKIIQESINTLLAQREATQPIRSKTGGSTFANPVGHSAWKLIDEAGCRGLKVGGAQVSEKHCNFLINFDNATAFDLEELGETVKKRVKDKSGIELRWEIQRIGSFLDQELKIAA
ncbi:MAG TPA: UDP-N-acetylenolpyruvoylglucosamine reductase [Holosporales bacterium]|nr:UDP-N-acetylenolpyruvoylglucosamine reductase [Holosporales bacterium]